MKKLVAALSVIVAGVVLVGGPASAAGSAGANPVADEPTWVIPFVVAFALVGAIAAVLSTRTKH